MFENKKNIANTTQASEQEPQQNPQKASEEAKTTEPVVKPDGEIKPRISYSFGVRINFTPRKHLVIPAAGPGREDL